MGRTPDFGWAESKMVVKKSTAINVVVFMLIKILFLDKSKTMCPACCSK
jgi:hypothetical protein